MVFAYWAFKLLKVRISVFSNINEARFPALLPESRVLTADTMCVHVHTFVGHRKLIERF
jgi:hypothetical protein